MKTTKLPAAPPMEANDVAIVTGGTVLWLVAFLVLLPFHSRLSSHHDIKWLWTCLTGTALGLIGIWYCRARRDAIARSRAAEAEAAGAAETPSA
ncbi:DUF2530 domain-containing protein [Streptacidiphilus sp. PAMC 29251]